MSVDSILEKVKQLREITGVGFKDCKSAIDETKGDIEKSIELLTISACFANSLSEQRNIRSAKRLMGQDQRGFVLELLNLGGINSKTGARNCCHSE